MSKKNGDKPAEDEQQRKETSAEFESRLQSMTQPELMIEMVKMQKEINVNLAILQKDVVNGYSATKNVIDTNLQGLANVLKPLFGQQPGQPPQQQGQQPAAGQQQQGQAQQPQQQAGQQNYFQPNGQQGQLPMNGLAGIFNNPVLAQAIVAKILGPDPSQNMYAVMGQRFFGESMVSHMLSERARMRKEAVMGVITNNELVRYIEMQEKMYGPMLGQSFGTEAGINPDMVARLKRQEGIQQEHIIKDAQESQLQEDGYYRIKAGKVVEKVEIEETAK